MLAPISGLAAPPKRLTGRRLGNLREHASEKRRRRSKMAGKRTKRQLMHEEERQRKEIEWKLEDGRDSPPNDDPRQRDKTWQSTRWRVVWVRVGTHPLETNPPMHASSFHSPHLSDFQAINTCDWTLANSLIQSRGKTKCQQPLMQTLTGSDGGLPRWSPSTPYSGFVPSSILNHTVLPLLLLLNLCLKVSPDRMF